MAKTLDSEFIQASSVDGVLYGIPKSDSMGAGVFYNNVLNEKFGLAVTLTWNE